MLHALLVLAAEGAETSKASFYIAGAILAAWAVALAAFGIARPGFPSAAAARGVIAVTTILVAGTLATSIITA